MPRQIESLVPKERAKRVGIWSNPGRDDDGGRASGRPAEPTYAPGRGAEHAMTLLGGYRGIVQCDGYAPYKQLQRGRAGNAVCGLLLGPPATAVLRDR